MCVWWWWGKLLLLAETLATSRVYRHDYSVQRRVCKKRLCLLHAFAISRWRCEIGARHSRPQFDLRRESVRDLRSPDIIPLRVVLNGAKIYFQLGIQPAIWSADTGLEFGAA